MRWGEGPLRAGQIVAGAGAQGGEQGAWLWIPSALSRSSELCRLGRYQLEGAKPGLKTQPLHSGIFAGQQGDGKRVPGSNVPQVSDWAGGLFLNLTWPHRNAWEGQEKL